MRKIDLDIRARTATELRKLGGDPQDIAAKLGCSYQLVRVWLDGDATPSAPSLALFHKHGCDIIYILTGGDSDARSKLN